MSNRQNQQNRQLLDTERTRSANQYQGFINTQQQRGDEYYNNARDTRQQVIDRYSNNNNFLPSGLTPNSSGFFNLPSGMQSAGGDFSKAKEGYSNFADTGGVNRADFDPALRSYRDFMTGGGLSEGDVSNMRYRATSQVPSFYAALKNNMARRANVQGGYTPGYDSQTQEMAREASRGSYDASRLAESDIADKIQQGRMFGTSGYGSLMSDITGKEQSGKLAGLGGLTNIGGMEQQNNQFNAGQVGDFQRSMIDAYQRGGITNAAGMVGINANDIGQYQTAMASRLAGIGGLAGNNLSNLGQRQQIQDRHWYDYLPGAVGAAGGIMGGIGSMGYQPFGASGNTGFFGRNRGRRPVSVGDANAGSTNA